MCYDDHARPPAAPGANGSAHGEDLVLTAADGNQYNAYFAHPTDQEPKAQLIIYPDVRGLHQFYKSLALRFAEAGVSSVAIDYFGRTAGLTARDDSFEFWPHVQQLKLETFFEDVKSAQAYLKQQPGTEKGMFVVGFCLGGSFSLFSATNSDFGFAGVIPFYAGLSRDLGQGTVLEKADKVLYPVLGQFGGDDANIPETDVQKLREQLTVAGVEHDVKTYAGAPHSFFDRKATEFADASDDSWHRILGFIEARATVSK